MTSIPAAPLTIPGRATTVRQRARCANLGTIMALSSIRWVCLCVAAQATVVACGGSSTGSGGGGGGGGGSSGGSGGTSSGGPGGSSGATSSSGAASSSGSGAGGGSSSSGASGSSGSSSGASGGDSAAAATTYPALKFSDIGQAVLVSAQFYFTEGPVWDPAKGVLYFTDINAHQGTTVGGAIYRLTPPSTIDVLLQPSGNADGLGLDPHGNIIGAGFVSRNAWRLSGTTRQTLAPCSQGSATCYSSQEVNTPDDIAARSDGVIYFTDPTFGSGGQGFATQTLPLSSAQGVYRLTTDGVLHLEDSTTSGPNGVNLSPDQKTLYVSYTLAATVAKFDVAADGSLHNKATFASATLADSMCVDAGGNVYVGTQTGLAVFDPAGHSLGTISVAGQIVTNCAFGGADQKTLFITSRASSTLFGTPAMGASSLYKVDAMPVPGIAGQN
jgi:gluconolactonase